jgi:hypothetical protein
MVLETPVILRFLSVVRAQESSARNCLIPTALLNCEKTLTEGIRLHALFALLERVERLKARGSPLGSWEAIHLTLYYTPMMRRAIGLGTGSRGGCRVEGSVVKRHCNTKISI